MRARGECTTWSLPYHCSPSAPSRSTASSCRLTPPFPLPADLGFHSSIRAWQRLAPHRQRLPARDPESPVLSSRRNRCIHFHPHPESSLPSRVPRKTARRQRCATHGRPRSHLLG